MKNILFLFAFIPIVASCSSPTKPTEQTISHECIISDIVVDNTIWQSGKPVIFTIKSPINFNEKIDKVATQVNEQNKSVLVKAFAIDSFKLNPGEWSPTVGTVAEATASFIPASTGTYLLSGSMSSDTASVVVK